jgi:subtilisin family serine protease
MLAGLTCAPAITFSQFAPATRVIVDVSAGVSPATVAAKHGIRPQQVFSEVANAFTADLTARQIALLEADRDVQQVAKDGIAGRIPRPRISLTLSKSDDPTPLPEQPPQFTTAAIRRVKTPLSVTADVDKIDDQRVDADIAILDGGVDPYHPELNVVGGADCVGGVRGEEGWKDRDGHGTLAAGFAAAIDNEIGVVGVAPGARIWAVRVADPFGFVTDSALLCGLEYIAKNRDIEVANLSLAGDGNIIAPCREHPQGGPRVKVGGPPQDRIHEQICHLVKSGVTVVAAAGNSAADAATFTPAAYEEVIAVSGFADFDGLPGGLAPTPPVCHLTERDDHFATFSNYGAVVDIAAPAVCVTATFPGGQYARVEGTSFAAPMVAGAAALLYARNPDISPAQVRQQIIDAAERNTISGDPDAFPDGALDVSSF